MRGDTVTYADLAPLRETLRAYRDYRRAHGAPAEGSLWEERITAELRRQGFPVRDHTTPDDPGDAYEPPEVP